MSKRSERRATRSARRLMLVALLAVLALGSWGAYAVFAATAPSTPTITASPSVSPTNSATESLAFTSSKDATSFQCSLNGSAFATCSSPKVYGSTASPLADGAYTFQVKALDKQGNASSAASYSWTVDRTAPTLVSINRADANPTKADPVHWTVTFSEPVSNVALANFSLTNSLLSGTATLFQIASVGSAPAAQWTVAVKTSGAQGSNTSSIQLNLNNKGSIQDAAGNGLGGTVPVAGQAYTFDTTAPNTSGVTITAVGSSPTNAASVSWTVTFSEAVAGGSAANFSLISSGFSGTPSISSVTGSGSTRTVTAATTATTTNTATLQLKLTSTSGIADLAGNALTGSLPVNGPTYTVDRFPPPVAFTQTPPDPNSVSTSTFKWAPVPPSQVSDFNHFECSTENGPYSTTVTSASGPAQPCASPLTYVVGTTNNGQHQFSVRAYDNIGNYTQVDYSWKVAAGSIQNFTISGSLNPTTQKLYPGGPSYPLPVTFANPNTVPITVTAFSTSVDPSSLPAGCQASWFPIVPSNIASTAGVLVPANGSVTLPAQGVSAPTIAMSDSGLQNACATATFTIQYTNGSAHS